MQEQNFEKQVKQKMEELSLTPSEPVWKKINEQVRNKRERRRFVLWLPLAMLLLSGGWWLISNLQQHENIIAEHKSAEETNKETATINNTHTETKKTNSGTKENSDPKNGAGMAKDLEKETPLFNKGNAQDQGVNTNLDRQQPLITPGNKANKLTFTNNSIVTRDIDHRGKISSVDKTRKLDQAKQPIAPGKAELARSFSVNDQTTTENVFDASMPFDSVGREAGKKVESNSDDKMSPVDSSVKKSDGAEKSDSLHFEKDVAGTRKSVSSKWKFGLEANIGSSGVNNGIGLFRGGAQSLETNAFARDMNFNFASPSNTSQGVPYRPPSSQKRAGSFLLGFIASKQVSKRSFVSSGLRYNFYSTKMKVGQNISRDTMVEANKTVGRFYSNSGSNFSDYHNNFHLIALPINFDFTLTNRLPLDFHIGLSIQQLVHTNALMYSSQSQVYYKDNEAFNKTFLFSEIGFEYSFPLSQSLLLKAGPRASYSHSKVIKASDHHFFSYGLTTQLVFSGK